MRAIRTRTPEAARSAAPRRRAALAPALLGLLAACSGIHVEAQAPAPGLAAARTYAWSPPPSAEDAEGDAALAVSLLEGVDAGLAARGYRPAALVDADLLVSVDVDVETRVATRHAYNTGFFTADRFEDGRVRVRLRDAASKATLWQGEGKHRLRREAQGYGPYQLQWVETGELRDWKVGAVVDAILARLPAAAD